MHFKKITLFPTFLLRSQLHKVPNLGRGGIIWGWEHFPSFAIYFFILEAPQIWHLCKWTKTLFVQIKISRVPTRRRLVDFIMCKLTYINIESELVNVHHTMGKCYTWGMKNKLYIEQTGFLNTNFEGIFDSRWKLGIGYHCTFWFSV